MRLPCMGCQERACGCHGSCEKYKGFRARGKAPASMADALAYIRQLEDHIGDITKKVERLEAQVPKWISVEERLPGTEDPVLILVKETEHYGLHKEKSKVYYCQYLAYWDDDEWYTSWCNGCRKISDTAKEPNEDEYEVTHWMPLPEPPKEV